MMLSMRQENSLTSVAFFTRKSAVFHFIARAISVATCTLRMSSVSVGMRMVVHDRFMSSC